MWSFFQSAPKTRYENLAELDGITDKITEIRIKQKTLAATPGANSLEYKKNSILVNILNDIDTKIAAFNQQPACANKPDELREAVKLLTSIQTHLNKMILSRREVLSEHRHFIPSKRVLATGVATFAAVTFAAVTVLPAALAVTTTVIGGTAATGSALRSIETKPKPASLLLLDELAHMLQGAITNIKNDLDLNFPIPAASGNNSPAPAAELTYNDFCCPILLTWMKEPVRCSLDNKFYERTAILRILGESRKSPHNRQPLPEGVLPSAVLEVDENFKMLMEAFRKDHPEVEAQIREDFADVPLPVTNREAVIEDYSDEEDDFVEERAPGMGRRVGNDGR